MTDKEVFEAAARKAREKKAGVCLDILAEFWQTVALMNEEAAESCARLESRS